MESDPSKTTPTTETNATTTPAPAAKAEKEIPPGTVEDFAKMDIRVGNLVECWKVSHRKQTYSKIC
jgi:hypothetical protein